MDERSQNELVLKLILEHVYAKGEWPLLRDLHRRIHRELETPFDVRDVIPRLVSSTITSHWTLQERIMLPLSTFRKSPRAAPLLRALASFIAYAVAKYRLSNDDVAVTQQEAAQVLGIGGRELQLLPLFVLRESFVWRGHQDTEAGWVIQISDEIVRMRDVMDVKTYLEVTDELKADAKREQAAAASAHYKMIRATTPQPSGEVAFEGSNAQSPGAPQGQGPMVRHRRGYVQFGVAVAASLVAAALWALLTGFFDSDVMPNRTPGYEAGVSSPAATPRTSPASDHGPEDWTYHFVEGVGDTDGNGAREVLVVEDDGTGTLFELGANDTLVNPLPTFHDWTPYELVTGVGNVDGDPTPEIFVVDGEDGWLLDRTSGGQWMEEANSIEFGRTWTYERIAGVADVDDSGVPEILGANWEGRGDIDELMFLEPGGRYNPDEHRHEVIAEEGDYDWITGVGDVDGNGRPEVLATMGTTGFLLSFCPNATYFRTDLGPGWDYDLLTSLRVFGDPGESAALGVDDGEAVIRKFGALKKDKRECRR